MASWDNQEKPGTLSGGWELNEYNLSLNALLDPDSGLAVRLNGIGTSQSWSNQTKS